jgi:short-subunit dehydrogenase
MELSGATVLVTGASSGIGAATARVLAERGATVGIVARRRDRLEQVLDDCRRHAPQSRLWAADLSDLDVAERVAREADDAFGGLDVLVNNAGAPKRRHVVALSVREAEQTMRLNYLSPVTMALTLLPRMIERGRGTIVNVASLGGRLGIAKESAYCASKFALAGWSEAAAIDLGGSGVDVRLVNPGAFESEIWDQPDNDPPFFETPKAPPEECADAIAAAIEGTAFETYAPDMREMVVSKTQDPDGFITMMAGLLRDTTRDSSAGVVA